MKKIITSCMLVGLIVTVDSCKKNSFSNTAIDCFPNDITTRKIVSKPASIRFTNGEFYILEQGTIDTKLNPCNLQQEYQIDNLLVTVSGDVKATVQGGSMPCCVENFVISSITR